MKTNYGVFTAHNELEIKVCLSDILKEQADACIIAEYPTKISNSGVCKALQQTPAKNAILAYNNEATRQRVPYGSARITPCNGDNYKYLIHISALGLTHHLASIETLYFCIRIALKQADKLGIETIVIPAINTGKTEMLSYNEAALNTLRAIFDIKHTLKQLKQIKIILKNDDAYRIYQEVLDLFYE